MFDAHERKVTYWADTFVWGVLHVDQVSRQAAAQDFVWTHVERYQKDQDKAQEFQAMHGKWNSKRIKSLLKILH